MMMLFFFFHFLLSDLIVRALYCLKTRTTTNDSELVRGNKVRQNRCSFVAIHNGQRTPESTTKNGDKFWHRFFSVLSDEQ